MDCCERSAVSIPRGRLAPSRAFSAVETMVPYTHSNTRPIRLGSSPSCTFLGWPSSPKRRSCTHQYIRSATGDTLQTSLRQGRAGRAIDDYNAICASAELANCCCTESCNLVPNKCSAKGLFCYMRAAYMLRKPDVCGHCPETGGIPEDVAAIWR